MRVPASDPAGLRAALAARFPAARLTGRGAGEVTMRVARTDLVATLAALRDEEGFAFAQLIDLCGVDYSEYGTGYEGLFTKDAMSHADRERHDAKWAGRYAVVYHLLSLRHNNRLRVRTFLDDSLPTCPTATGVWPVADWFEREAFDLYGILFDGHPDLRRLLTDYGFIGHPFRKDFPVHGTVEMRYDPAQGRVVYQPVSIEPREVVPRIRRHEGFGIVPGDG